MEGLDDPSIIVPRLAYALSYGYIPYDHYSPPKLAVELFQAIAEKLDDPSPVTFPLLELLGDEEI